MWGYLGVALCGVALCGVVLSVRCVCVWYCVAGGGVLAVRTCAPAYRHHGSYPQVVHGSVLQVVQRHPRAVGAPGERAVPILC